MACDAIAVAPRGCPATASSAAPASAAEATTASRVSSVSLSAAAFVIMPMSASTDTVDTPRGPKLCDPGPCDLGDCVSGTEEWSPRDSAAATPPPLTVPNAPKNPAARAFRGEPPRRSAADAASSTSGSAAMRSMHETCVSASDLSAEIDHSAASRRARSSSRKPASSLALAPLSFPPRDDNGPDTGPVQPRAADCTECLGDAFASMESNGVPAISPTLTRRGTGISLDNAPPGPVGLGRGTIVVAPPSYSTSAAYSSSVSAGLWPHASRTHLASPRTRDGCERSESASDASAFADTAATRLATRTLAAPRAHPNSAAHADIPLSLARVDCPASVPTNSADSASSASAAGATAVCVGPSPEQLRATTRSTMGPDSILQGPKSSLPLPSSLSLSLLSLSLFRVVSRLVKSP